jgi:hypothetical protein
MVQKIANKKSMLIFFVVSLFSISLESKMFLGKIVFPEKVAPMLRLYYNGKSLVTDTKKDEEYKTIPFSIDEFSWVQDINVLVCYNVACSSENNNITNLRVPSSEPYKFYALEAARSYDGKGKEVLSWNSTEQELEDNIIPDNTIIFIFDPNLVDGLDIPVWNKEDQMRLLPGIIMSEKASAKDFIRAMNIAYLSGMDVDICHQKAEKTSTQNNRIVATLPNSSGSFSR